MQTAIPVLPTLHIKNTILFYENTLGFTATDIGGYAIIKKGNVELHFFLCADEYLCNNTTCLIKVADVQCLFAEMVAIDMVLPENGLKEKFGRKLEFSIKDNNGVTLRFVQEKR
jgi:hypothetical protein